MRYKNEHQLVISVRNILAAVFLLLIYELYRYKKRVVKQEFHSNFAFHSFNP